MLKLLELRPASSVEPPWTATEEGTDSMTIKKTYYPAKTFDDDIDAFSKLFKDKGWSFSNIDPKQLAKDAVEQRTERATHDALESKFTHAHETFGVDQEQRHERFRAALKAARGAFANDKGVMAELDRFKRSVVRTKKKAKEPVPAPKG